MELLSRRASEEEGGLMEVVRPVDGSMVMDCGETAWSRLEPAIDGLACCWRISKTEFCIHRGK